MNPKTGKPQKATGKDAPMASRTKSFILQGSTAAKIEALADTLHQSESAIVNELLEKGAAQMILERAPTLAQNWPPLRCKMGRIEGALRIRRAGAIESESERTYSFEIIGEITDFSDRPAVLLTLAYIYDARQTTWRRLTEDEAAQLVRDVHGGSQLFVITSAGVRWALVEVRDLVNRDFVPPLRDVLVRLRRVPADVCPWCQSPLGPSKVPAATYACTNVECQRFYGIDRAGNLVLAPGSPEGRTKAAPLTFAQLRGAIAPGFRITDETLRAARAHRREFP